MKKGKGKAAKKAMKFAERKAKAEKWVAEYDGTPYGGDIIKPKVSLSLIITILHIRRHPHFLPGDPIRRTARSITCYIIKCADISDENKLIGIEVTEAVTKEEAQIEGNL